MFISEAWFLGMLDIRTKESGLIYIPNIKFESIIPLILECVRIGTTIHTNYAPVNRYLPIHGYFNFNLII